MKRVALKVMFSMGAVLTLLIAYGFMKTPIEGHYRSKPCLCGSVNSIKFTEGKIVLYHCNHPPAELAGRYEVEPDGSVKLYGLPLGPDEPEDVFAVVYPRRFLCTESPWWQWQSWMWRRPMSGELAKADADYEIMDFVIGGENASEKIYYSREFKEIRRETLP